MYAIAPFLQCIIVTFEQVLFRASVGVLRLMQKELLSCVDAM